MVDGALPVALLGLRSVVAAEERVLANDFGARYRDYCRRVPRFVPRPPFPRTTGIVDWQRGLRKEHGTIFGAVTTALLLAATEDFARMGRAAWLRRGPALLGVWLAAAAVWILVRHLKHTGRLGDASAPTSAAGVADGLPADVAA